MKVIIILLCTFVFLYNYGVLAQTKTAKKYPGTPFQGTKEYCDFLKPLRFKVTIAGYDVTITRLYDNNKSQIVKGTYKKGKLFTNSTLEKQFDVSGRLYVIYPASFGINNLEGGDYTTYELCSKR